MDKIIFYAIVKMPAITFTKMTGKRSNPFNVEIGEKVSFLELVQQMKNIGYLPEFPNDIRLMYQNSNITPLSFIGPVNFDININVLFPDSPENELEKYKPLMEYITGLAKFKREAVIKEREDHERESALLRQAAVEAKRKELEDAKAGADLAGPENIISGGYKRRRHRRKSSKKKRKKTRRRRR